MMVIVCVRVQCKYDDDGVCDSECLNEDAKARQKTIRQLRMIADDLEKGCGGFNRLIGVDLASWVAGIPPIKT